jgi:hypothetical protein
VSARGHPLPAILLAAAAVFAVPASAQDNQRQARAEAFARLGYWPGYWVASNSVATPISGIPERFSRQLEGGPQEESLGIWEQRIPWNEEGKRRVAEALAGQGGRKGLGWGYPLMMNSSTPIQFLITPEETLIVNAYNETRHVYTDGRNHPPLEDLWPTVTGNSIGHWEGEVLVIDTIMVTNPNHFFQGAPPLSEEARYVERIWLDGDTLRTEVTVTDPVTLTAPWISHVAWVRDEGFDRMIQVDWTNDRTGVEGNTNTIEPLAED